jgi:peroxiredoxin
MRTIVNYEVLDRSRGFCAAARCLRAIPTVLVIDRHGTIRQHFVGGRSEQDLRSAIQSVLETER